MQRLNVTFRKIYHEDLILFHEIVVTNNYKKKNIVKLIDPLLLTESKSKYKSSFDLINQSNVYPLQVRKKSFSVH